MNTNLNVVTGKEAAGKAQGVQQAAKSTVNELSTQGGGHPIKGRSSFLLDIQGAERSGQILGQEKGKGKGLEDIMQDASMQNPAAQKDFMTLAANTMSPEAYAEMAKDGFHIEDMDPEEIEDTVDQIKARMAEAGVVIRGYNDDLQREDLEEITGSAAYAAEITRALHEQNLPVTQENAEGVWEAVKMAESIPVLTDAVRNYMVENALEPTIENLYLASHSASGKVRTAGAAYVSESGYLGKTAAMETGSAVELKSQLESIIRKSGDEVNEISMERAERMLSQGVALTGENYRRMQQLEELKIPVSTAEAADAAARALADMQPAVKAELGRTQTLLERAVEIDQTVRQITPQAVEEAAERGVPLTIENIAEIQGEIAERNIAEQGAAAEEEAKPLNVSEAVNEAERLWQEWALRADKMREQNAESRPVRSAEKVTATESLSISIKESRTITARRQFAEVRLTMTVELNYKMLKRGFSVDTSELSRLVEELKSREKEMFQRRFEAKEDVTAALRAENYENTRKILSELPGFPIALAGDLLIRRESVTTVTLTQYAEEGRAAAARYAEAGERYETMMTQPRADLGDDIRTAFERADSLMETLGIEPTEDNARAVRILGYNQMEISTENVAAVREAYEEVQTIVERMSPAETLKMIREGLNPMQMTMEDLSRRLKDVQPDSAKISEFLVQRMERGEITEEEKESFIGIYRMLHQISKRDSAAVGTLLKQGKKISFSSLLTAVRSYRDRGIDARIDDTESISKINVEGDIEKQISSAFAGNASEKDAEAENSENEAAIAMGAYLSDIEDMLEAGNAPVAVYEELKNLGIPAGSDMVGGLHALRHHRGGLFRELRRNAVVVPDEAAAEKETEDGSALSAEESRMLESFDHVLDSMENAEMLQSAYGEMLARAEEMLDDAGDRIDIRVYHQLMKQLGTAGRMAKEEVYEIPMEIGGEQTGVSVRFRNGGGEESDVRIEMEHPQLGRISARFTGSPEGHFSGYVMYGNEDAGAVLSSLEAVLRQRTEELGLEMEELNFVQTGRGSINISRGAADEKSTGADTSAYYRIARVFLQIMGSVRD